MSPQALPPNSCFTQHLLDNQPETEKERLGALDAPSLFAGSSGAR
jgi:hypothetical protein